MILLLLLVVLYGYYCSECDRACKTSTALMLVYTSYTTDVGS
jgi:hypothetical protein